jgi:hypothetical protein
MRATAHRTTSTSCTVWPKREGVHEVVLIAVGWVCAFTAGTALAVLVDLQPLPVALCGGMLWLTERRAASHPDLKPALPLP